MQPYFFPYLGHFALVANVDRWLVFDITQYTPRNWMNRNRILHPAGGVQYVTVALANTSIRIRTHEARVLDSGVTRRSLLGKMTHYRRTAPYYERVMEIVENVFRASCGGSLATLNVLGLEAVCRYLGIPFEYDICSRMKLDLPPGLGPGEWAPAICSRVGATEYLNPIGGKYLFSSDLFDRSGVRLSFLEYDPMVYPVGGYAFEPNLSILDVLMWNSPESVMSHLRAAARLFQSAGIMRSEVAALPPGHFAATA